jgi:SnoaL-like protein
MTQVVKGPIALMATFLVLAACSSATPTPTARGPDLAGVLRQQFDAVNRDDVPGVLASFTDDATLVRGGCAPEDPCVGKAAIQLQFQRGVGQKARYTVLSLDVSGDTATGRAELRNVNITNLGLDRAIENFTATFKGDKISSLIHSLDVSDSQSAAFANFHHVAGVWSIQRDHVALGDVPGAMAAVTDDIVLQGFGLCLDAPCVGKAAVQKEIEREVADHQKYPTSLSPLSVTGDTMTTRWGISSDSITSAGVERVVVSTATVVRGDKVAAIKWVLDATDVQTASYLKSLGK